MSDTDIFPYRTAAGYFFNRSVKTNRSVQQGCSACVVKHSCGWLV
ncbi:hypothetical protein [Marinibactrum halimedae]|nr:hypothetical protein [Marinibactrum halimedae]